MTVSSSSSVICQTSSGEQTLASWLLTLAFVVTVGAIAYALLSLIPAGADVEAAGAAKLKSLSSGARRASAASSSASAVETAV